ncbi:hypothetical protein [Paludisphaera soli]|uniref:hypothetical protein n=1 Tax=Paludisphaera soli TaxID=2712865 RepID=UPI0013EDDB26|nr:hypothetical protein [Paludisphaera soli]
MQRISIRTVMAFVLIASIVMAAVSVGSPPWAGAMLSTSFFTLTCSLLGVVFGRHDRRTYCTGFAALGWSYMALMYGPGIDVKVGRFLLAPQLARILYDAIHAEAPAPNATPAGGGGFQSVPVGPVAAATTAGGGGFGPVGPVRPARADMGRIAIAVEALFWAFLGGWAALAFASGKDGCSGGGRAADRKDDASPATGSGLASAERVGL